MINNRKLQTAFTNKIRESKRAGVKQLDTKILKTPNRNKELLPNMQNNYILAQLKNINLKQGNIIGKGSFGNVYKINGKDIVYKEIPFKVNKDNRTSKEYGSLVFQDLLQKSFNNDVSKLKYLCILHEYGFIDNRFSNSAIYTIMDNCGIELGVYINKLKENGTLTLEKIIEIMIECCKALHVIHDSGYVHLDVKPQNFLVHNVEKTNKNGEVYTELEIKIIDFGFVSKKEKKINPMGTPHYIAPEMLGYYPITTDVTLDIFSLGCFFVQLILFYSIDKCYSLEDIYICPIEKSDDVTILLRKRKKYNSENDLSTIKKLLEIKYFIDKLKLPGYKNTNLDNKYEELRKPITEKDFQNIREKIIEPIKKIFNNRNIKFTNSIIFKIMNILKKMINAKKDMRYSDISNTISDLEEVFIYSNNKSTNKIRNNKEIIPINKRTTLINQNNQSTSSLNNTPLIEKSNKKPFFSLLSRRFKCAKV